MQRWINSVKIECSFLAVRLEVSEKQPLDVNIVKRVLEWRPLVDEAGRGGNDVTIS